MNDDDGCVKIAFNLFEIKIQSRKKRPQLSSADFSLSLLRSTAATETAAIRSINIRHTLALLYTHTHIHTGGKKSLLVKFEHIFCHFDNKKRNITEVLKIASLQ